MSTSSKASLAPAAANASREPFGRLRLRNDRRDVAEHLGDAQAADVLRQVAPVRADVAERRRGAALVGLEAPRVVGVLEQPVLQVVADEEVRLADVPARDRVPRLLHERVAAIVERDGVDDPGLGGLVDELLGFRRGHRQRLVGDDVLALGNRRRVDRVVQVVGRGVVHHVDVGVVQERVVAAVGLRHPERIRLRSGRGVAAAGNGHDVDEPQPPDRVNVVRTDKAGAHDAHPDPFHQHPPEAVIGTPSYIRDRPGFRA